MNHDYNTLAEAHHYFTTCNIATLAQMIGKKSTPINELARQISICIKMVRVLKKYTNQNVENTVNILRKVVMDIPNEKLTLVMKHPSMEKYFSDVLIFN